MKIFSVLLIILLTVTGCSISRQNPKYGFASGTYHSKVFKGNSQKVYVDNEVEQIKVYPVRNSSGRELIDTSGQRPIVLDSSQTGKNRQNYSFRQNSFDLDFLTIPFKYRPATTSLPRQINTSLNGAVYLGYRSDLYVLNYDTNPLGKSVRQTTHVGFSFGAFTGLGSTPMNPWVTDNQINKEYDGVVWSKGVAAIIGVNNFTTGLALGWDHLLDNNNKLWIYQTRPWIGLTFGLNIN